MIPTRTLFWAFTVASSSPGRTPSLARSVTTHYTVRSRDSDPRWKGIDMERQSDKFDVVVIGGGPAGLSAAIRLKQLSNAASLPLRVCLIEKASQFGGHTISGAVIDVTSLNELIPNWRELDAPVNQPVTQERLVYLTKNRALPLFIPKFVPVHNDGCYVVRLGNLVVWLSQQAEVAGVELYPGVSASEVLYYHDGSVKGIATTDMGIHKDGAPKTTFTRGFEMHADVSVFAEGCRGHLSKQIIARHGLDEQSCHQVYGIGLKELWEVPDEKHVSGKVVHTVGWPLDRRTYGGSFMYHYGDSNLVGVGLVVGLNYRNPYLNPFGELQKLKTHKLFRKTLEGGRRVGYGARALVEGGLQSIPKLNFPGGCLVGDSAGFLNVPRIKGVHCAMKSGILAAEAIFDALRQKSDKSETRVNPEKYDALFKESWLYEELKMARNVRPSFETPLGLYSMLAYSAFSLGLTRGREPWTFGYSHKDNETLVNKEKGKMIHYPKPDGKLTFDLLSSVMLTGTNHDHDQPPHLTLLDDSIPANVNWHLFDGPEQRYCPAAVYEYAVPDDGAAQLVINAQNCIHCKTCDIKDPRQNINWVAPEGGGGPSYNGM